jgi:hypothetical protein
MPRYSLGHLPSRTKSSMTDALASVSRESSQIKWSDDPYGTSGRSKQARQDHLPMGWWFAFSIFMCFSMCCDKVPFNLPCRSQHINVTVQKQSPGS